LFLSPLSQFPK